ncbi:MULTISPECIES: flagellin N-terminal helical domain-containing protein [Alteromonas]|jgi:flagellin|uniref:Flagellin n=1 Tax=Alteromonas macleodii TaxID=28108 RepID=A0A1E7DG37_ALTMA|nr:MULTISPECIES: flagellin [Alteromonas]MEC8376185.1 flagellin [Pseudomonadota bacterium]NKX31150.1 flagellin FliC [Alteromonadaceae bacterium A_SAG1]KHT58537.1 flagellin [Alteromonas macleodii]OES33913.1 bacterial flagellin C-terminal helical region family protein [Alteromonas macleodii]OES35003.1 bacterial flagellin C-terminal helical region family protein [Alteromonas macleodii]|tara:strand:+ start:574 stop:1413 length:840 start_codon:yes stop_codon:yes gene_type:complete|eukprot:INCI308.1.p1 GENE.INCI308.1~~INCI308.1.p1  ORF type:complete len:280 (+),score=16.83 INCI308.1:137-976(+)
MSLFVNTNVSSINAQRQLFDVNDRLNTSFERLSSGFRINSAADDAAGLQISDRLTSQVQGLNQAVRNANDAISLSQTAEGALSEVTTSLQRIRTLAVQSQNGINSSADRQALQKEVSALRTEISRIATDTQFGNVNILDGNFSAKFLVGANAGQTISVNLSSTNLGSISGFSATGLGITTNDVSTAAGASSLLSDIDAAISGIGAVRADLGALQNRFQSTIRNLSNISENLSSARSQIRDTDFATETAELTRNQIIQQASVSVLSQANQRPQTALSLLG